MTALYPSVEMTDVCVRSRDTILTLDLVSCGVHDSMSHVCGTVTVACGYCCPAPGARGHRHRPWHRHRQRHAIQGPRL